MLYLVPPLVHRQIKRSSVEALDCDGVNSSYSVFQICSTILQVDNRYKASKCLAVVVVEEEEENNDNGDGDDYCLNLL